MVDSRDNNDTEATAVPILAVTAAVGAVVLLVVLLCNLFRRDVSQSTEDGSKGDSITGSGQHEDETADAKKNGAGGGIRKRRPVPKKDVYSSQFSHPWLASTLKGHAAPIIALDFSPNGKQLVTCAQDRTVLLWFTQELNQKEHRSIRSNVEFDHLTSVKFCPDNKALIGSLFTAGTVRIFKMNKKPDGTPTNFKAVFDFEKEHVAEIISIGIAGTGKYIMTCSKDTQIRIWNLKGEVLASVDTHQVNNSYAAVSPCGRFVASSGFTSDVKVWEVCFDKAGVFREVARAFELTGHSAGIHHFDFSADSSRMASVSKDGSWKFWDTDIEYQKNQDACVLRSCPYSETGPSLIALAPDGRSVAIATGCNISLFSTASGECAQTFTDVHSCAIRGVQFDSTSAFLVSCGDKHIQVLHNVAGHRTTITELEEKRRKATSQAMKERLETQIKHSRSTLASIGLSR